MEAERWFVIRDAKGKPVSAWPKIGVAKIHCRTELKDSIAEAVLLLDVPEDAKSLCAWKSQYGLHQLRMGYGTCNLPSRKPAKKGVKRGK